MGNVYPRGGFLHHVDDYKAAAVVGSARGRHRHPPWSGACVPAAAVANGRDGYHGQQAPQMESDLATGKWQNSRQHSRIPALYFPQANPRYRHNGAIHAWALWRPIAKL